MEQILNSIWGSSVAWFGGACSLMLFIRKVTIDADDDLNYESRKNLFNTLSRESLWSSVWVPDFNQVFDRFFGKNHFRWQCFYKSSLISLITFFAIYIAFDVAGIHEQELGIFNLLLFVLISNILIDYFSLLETRFILNTKMPTPLKILVDFVLTILLCTTWILIIVNVYLGEDNFLGNTVFNQADELFTTMFLFYGNEQFHYVNVFHLIVLTSFVTSIWLWLHGLSQFTIKIFSASDYFMGNLNTKEKPLRAIGVIINAYVLILSIIFFPVSMIT